MNDLIAFVGMWIIIAGVQLVFIYLDRRMDSNNNAENLNKNNSAK